MNKKYLLDSDNLDLLKRKISESKNVLLFLDYDGTLAPFKTDPLTAFAVSGIKKSLNKLEKSSKYYLTLISGRKLTELKKMIKLKNSSYAGSHGLEIAMFLREDIIYPQENDKISRLSREKYKKTKEKYKKLAGVQLEDKGFGIALHFESKEKQPKKEKELKTLFKNSDYQVLSGRKVIEIRPAGWNKGKAVNFITNEIKEKLTTADILKIYLGDDQTDEDAFKVIDEGITVYIQNEAGLNTAAEYYLENPKDTAKLLEILAGEI